MAVVVASDLRLNWLRLERGPCAAARLMLVGGTPKTLPLP